MCAGGLGIDVVQMRDIPCFSFFNSFECRCMAGVASHCPQACFRSVNVCFAAGRDACLVTREGVNRPAECLTDTPISAELYAAQTQGCHTCHHTASLDNREPPLQPASVTGSCSLNTPMYRDTKHSLQSAKSATHGRDSPSLTSPPTRTTTQVRMQQSKKEMQDCTAHKRADRHFLMIQNKTRNLQVR
jgi:hypothetical protein